MAQITLNEYFGFKKQYSLNLTSECSDMAITELSDESGRHPFGLCTFQKVGTLFKPDFIFVAVYVYQQIMYLRIGSQTFDLTDKSIKLVRQSYFFYRKKFTVLKDEQPLIKISYYNNNWLDEEFPDVLDGDFMTFIVYWAQSQNQIDSFISWWTAISQGKEESYNRALLGLY